ncbi:MAG: hypothetical protein QM760_15640 [Nibricoccus sp.]
MHNLRLCALWVSLAPAALLAQTTTSGTVAAGGGVASVDGDVPAFQQATQHRKDGYGGIEELTILREGKDSLLKFDLRLIPGDDDYRVAVRYDFNERFYVDAGYEQFRVFYDGSGGYFSPNNLQFVLYDEDLSLLRTKIWTEVGATIENGTYFKLRYERRGRDGTKGSTHWGDTNLTGGYSTRSIVPAFYDLNEFTNTFSVEAGNETKEESKWNAGASYSQTELDNKRNSRRRPNESASRYVTTKDTSTTDIFAAHGYYLTQIGEKLTISGGALITDLDSNISGSRIYGQSYDPVYDPGYANRQQRDEGFYDLGGGADMKQTVLNLNAVYIPRKNWSIRPSLRFENQHQETMVEFVETNVGGSPGFVSSREEVEAESEREFDEFSEEIEVRYTGKRNWTFIGAAQFVQTTGDLSETRTPHNAAPTIDRDTEIKRDAQKYSFTSNWYAKPGLTFAAQYYFKVKINDYDAVRDNTPASPTSGDRYPAFITDQDFETYDFNFRVSWRPAPLLNLVTRYDFQRSTVVSVEAGLPKGKSSEYNSQILSQNVTWSPTPRLYVTGNVNFTYDELATPAYAFVQNSDNNYVNGSVGGGYALAKLDDIYVDYTWFHASNFTDTSRTAMPFNLSQDQQAVTITWVRRQSEHLIYTVKYGYITNDDATSGGRNDFDAHTIYGKVQYHF